jgi:hypothetical protein
VQTSFDKLRVESIQQHELCCFSLIGKAWEGFPPPAVYFKKLHLLLISALYSQPNLTNIVKDFASFSGAWHKKIIFTGVSTICLA